MLRSLRPRSVRIVLLAAFAAGGCSNDSGILVAPTPAGLTIWDLTATLTSVTGPPICFDQRSALGTSTNRFLHVTRSGTAIRLSYGNDEPTELVGSTAGDAFNAASTSFPGYQPCGDTRVDYQFESRVAGQFSADGNAISAKETWTYRLTSGETVALSFDWMASRR